VSIAFPLDAIARGPLAEAARQRAHEIEPDDEAARDRVRVTVWAGLVATHRYDDPGSVHVVNAVRDVLAHEDRDVEDADLAGLAGEAQAFVTGPAAEIVVEHAADRNRGASA